jgi:pimeloyl-ACP methyl ester carboxylesterase
MPDSNGQPSGPTVVLVHGAFADAGSWAPVTQRLVSAGVPVTAIVNPLRGVRSDAAYVASAINQIPGPVLAVGHSYGGMIITNAVPDTSNVVGLVYVAAFAPDEGETLGGIVGRSKDSVLTTAVLEKQFPTGDGSETAAEFIIDPARFREVFTADLSQLDSDVYGLSQRPIAASALSDETGHPAWKDDLPVWAAVGTQDKAAGADVVRSMAQRAGAEITEIEGSHVIMISQPDAVTDVILTALKGVSG